MRTRASFLFICVFAGSCATSPGSEPEAPASPEAPPAAAGGAPEPIAAEPIVAEPCAFFAPDGLRLVGTLRRPARPGPVPGIVLVHGSGPIGRKGEVPGQLGMGFGFDLPLLEQLATGLAERGFAVLSYDKRTCGPFNQCTDNGYPQPTLDMTMETLLGDVLAAGDALASDEAVDPNRILLLGHSQGGTLVPHALAKRPDWRGGLLLATPHRPIDAIIQAQADKVAELLRATGTLEVKDTPLQRLADEAARARALSPEDPALEAEGPLEAFPNAQPVFWRSWIDLSDRAPEVAAATGRPHAVFGGTMDWNVPPSELDRWEATLAEVATATVVRLPDVTHAMNRLAETDIEKLRPEHIGRTIWPPLVDKLAQAARAMLAR